MSLLVRQLSAYVWLWLISRPLYRKDYIHHKHEMRRRSNKIAGDFEQLWNKNSTRFLLLSRFIPSQMKMKKPKLIEEKRIKPNFLGTWAVNVHTDIFKNISVCDAR